MNQHEKTKLALKITGGICLGIGLFFSIIGFVDFFGSMRGDGMPEMFWCLFLGFPLIAIGAGMLGAGFKREIMQYHEKESAPVVNEAAKDMKPAVKTVVSAVKEGLADEKRVVCVCGTQNKADSKFCKGCGKPLVKLCPKCGAHVSPDGAFCEQCGEKLN